MLDDVSLLSLFLLLLGLIIASAFFSGSETGMMAINRYRLRHLEEMGNADAKRVRKLLQNPDRLIGVILLGNNFVNVLASSIATVIALKLWGEVGIAPAAGILTLVILIFGEVTPKTLAALHPERVAFPVSYLIQPLLWLLYPLVWWVNFIGNSFLKLFGVSVKKNQEHELTTEELRSVLGNTTTLLPQRHRNMLLGILELEQVTVNDIMVPRHEIIGIDLAAPLSQITRQLANSQHTRLPVYEENMDNIIGIVHLKKLLRLFHHDDVNKDNIRKVAREAYFMPVGAPLYTQLQEFQQHKRRIGLVVNEYGDIQGLVTLDDILEEVVGEFTTSSDNLNQAVFPQSDGSFLIDASINVRELNRIMHWHLPLKGPKTLNGLILDYMEVIPEQSACLRLKGYPLEIVQVTKHTIKTVKVCADYRQYIKKEEN